MDSLKHGAQWVLGIIRGRYNAVQIVWECKNYHDLKAEDFQQASYYLTNEAGRFGIIAFRGEIKKHYYEHLGRIAHDKDGMVLLITEKDLKVFLRQAMHGKVKESHLHEIYDRTVRELS